MGFLRADQLDSNAVISNLIVVDDVIARGRAFSLRRIIAQAVILIGSDADGFAVAREPVVFDNPIPAGVVFGDMGVKFGNSFRPKQDTVPVFPEIVLAHLHPHAIFDGDARLPVVPDAVVFEGIFAGKTKPEAVVAVVSIIIVEHVSPAEGGFESDIGTPRGVVLLEKVVVARRRLVTAGQPGQEKAIPTQPGEVSPEGVVRRAVDDQESSRVRAHVTEPLAAWFPTATEVGIVDFKQAIVRTVQVEAKPAAIIGEVVSHGQVAAVVGEQAAHLVGEVVAFEAAVRHVPEQDAAAVRVFGWTEDVEEEGIGRDFGGVGDAAVFDGQSHAIFGVDTVHVARYGEIFDGDSTVSENGDPHAVPVRGDNGGPIAIQGDTIGGESDPVGEFVNAMF